jgi:hypothetical protein
MSRCHRPSWQEERIMPLRRYVWWGLLLGLVLVPRWAMAARQNLVVFYDTNYSTRYGGDPDPALQYFKAQGFQHLDTPGLLAWMDGVIKDGQAPTAAVVQLSVPSHKFNDVLLHWSQAAARSCC